MATLNAPKKKNAAKKINRAALNVSSSASEACRELLKGCDRKEFCKKTGMQKTWVSAFVNQQDKHLSGRTVDRIFKYFGITKAGILSTTKDNGKTTG